MYDLWKSNDPPMKRYAKYFLSCFFFVSWIFSSFIQHPFLDWVLNQCAWDSIVKEKSDVPDLRALTFLSGTQKTNMESDKYLTCHVVIITADKTVQVHRM